MSLTLRLATTGSRTTPRVPLLSSGANHPAHGRLTGLVALVLVIATPLAIAFHYVARAYFHAGYPWDTFLVNPTWHFNDFYLPYVEAQKFHPGSSGSMVYSPVLHLLMTAMTAVPASVAFAAVVAVFLGVLVSIVWRWITASDEAWSSRAQTTAILVLLSYPVLFVLDRGNLEMVVFILLALFFWLYYARGSRWAWIPLALAIAGKYYWVTLLVLLLSDRNVRQAVLAFAGAVASTLLAAAALAATSGYSAVEVLRNTMTTLSARGGGLRGALDIQHAHTLWSVVQVLNRLTGYSISSLPHLTTGYFAIAALLFALVAYNVLSRDLEPWRKVTVLVAATLVLPFESFDYTLLHLYFPLAVIVCTAVPCRASRATVWLLAVCLAPAAYYYFVFSGFRLDVGVSVLLYGTCLGALLIVPLVGAGDRRLSWRSLLVWSGDEDARWRRVEDRGGV